MTKFELHVQTWSECSACFLSERRQNVVLARGDIPCDVLFVGEAPGPSEDIIGAPFCLQESQRVLMANLTWKPLGDIQVGDQLLAPDEHGVQDVSMESASGHRGRKWRVATVTAVRKDKKRCYRVITWKGDLIGTLDHRVLTCHRVGMMRSRWMMMGTLKLGWGSSRASNLVHVFDPWKQDTSYEAGWVGGFLAGEGHVGTRPSGKARCGFAQNPGQTLDQAREYLAKFGFESVCDTSDVVKNKKYRVLGGFNKIVQLLGRTRPERLITNFVHHIQSRPTSLYGITPVPVIHRDPTETSLQDVVDIKTTTGTFICEGFVVHNCGPAGQLLDVIIAKALGEQPRVKIAFTNLTACIPLEDDGSQKFAEPPDECVKACEPRLVEFIDIVNPKLIVRVGRLAQDWLDPKYKHCVRLPERMHKRIPFADIMHPAGILRAPIAARGLMVKKCVVTIRDAVEALN